MRWTLSVISGKVLQYQVICISAEACCKTRSTTEVTRDHKKTNITSAGLLLSFFTLISSISANGARGSVELSIFISLLAAEKQATSVERAS